MKNRINFTGSLHLAAVLAVVVVAAIAAIGVKVLSASHADPLGDRIISDSAPKNDAILSGYTPLITRIDTQREVTNVSFRVNGKAVNDSGFSKCYPAAQPAPAPGTYVTCWDSRTVADGKYNLVVQATFRNGRVSSGAPVLFTVRNAVPVPAITIIYPKDGSSVKSGWIYAQAQGTADIQAADWTVNGKPTANAAASDLSKCISAVSAGIIPAPLKYTAGICVNSLDPAYTGISRFTFAVTGTVSGKRVASAPVTVTVAGSGLTVSFMEPKEGAIVSGFVKVWAATSINANVDFTVNGSPMQVSPYSSCGVPPSMPNIRPVCFNVSAAPYASLSKLAITANAADSAGNKATATVNVLHQAAVSPTPAVR